MKLTELLLEPKVVFLSTGRSDQKAIINCTGISFVILYMYFSYHYFTVPESTDTEIEKTDNFEFLNSNSSEFNYPVMSLNFPSKLRKNENTWPWLIAYDSSANQENTWPWVIAYDSSANQENTWQWLIPCNSSANQENTWPWLIAYDSSANQENTWPWLIAYDSSANQENT